MSLSAPEIAFLQDFVAQRSGNVVRTERSDLFEARLLPLAKSCGMDNLQQLVAELRRSSVTGLGERVAEAVTVNETSFFRDLHPFNALRTRVIPQVASRNSQRREIRIWCGACSSGQEPYSIAMVLREHFLHLHDWKIEIVATDLSEEMLAKSRKAEYSQMEVNRGMPAGKLVRFFERRGMVWQAKPELRELMQFRRLNLTAAWPYLGEFDIVFLRNVLIYFEPSTKAEVLHRIRRVLRPDGYLFIGSAETVIGLSVPFQREELDATVCYRPING